MGLVQTQALFPSWDLISSPGGLQPDELPTEPQELPTQEIPALCWGEAISTRILQTLNAKHMHSRLRDIASIIHCINPALETGKCKFYINIYQNQTNGKFHLQTFFQNTSQICSHGLPYIKYFFRTKIIYRVFHAWPKTCCSWEDIYNFINDMLILLLKWKRNRWCNSIEWSPHHCCLWHVNQLWYCDVMHTHKVTATWMIVLKTF